VLAEETSEGKNKVGERSKECAVCGLAFVCWKRSRANISNASPQELSYSPRQSLSSSTSSAQNQDPTG
jgi:hypothetical protein